MSGIGKIIPSSLRNIGNKLDLVVKGFFLKAKAKNTTQTPETNQTEKAQKKDSSAKSIVWNMIKNKLSSYRSTSLERKRADPEAKQQVNSQEAKRLVNTIVDKSSMSNVIQYLKGASQDIRNAMVGEAKIAAQNATEDGKTELAQLLESFASAVEGEAKASNLQAEGKRLASTIADEQSSLQLGQFLNQASPSIREATVDAAKVRAQHANDGGDSKLAQVLENFVSTIEGQGAKELNLQAEARRLVSTITDEKTMATLTLFLYEAGSDIRDAVVVEARSKAQYAVEEGDTKLAQTLLDFAVSVEDRVDIAAEHRASYQHREAKNLISSIVDRPSMMQVTLFLKEAGAGIRQASIAQARSTAQNLVESGDTELAQLLLDFAVAIESGEQDQTTLTLETTDLDAPDPDSTSALDELFRQLDEEKPEDKNQRVLAKTLLDKATDQASMHELAQDLKQADGQFLQVVADEAWTKLESLKLSGNTSLTEPLLELINDIESTSLVRRMVENINSKADMLALVIDLEASPASIRQNVVNEAKQQAAKANPELGGILLELATTLENQ